MNINTQVLNYYQNKLDNKINNLKKENIALNTKTEVIDINKNDLMNKIKMINILKTLIICLISFFIIFVSYNIKAINLITFIILTLIVLCIFFYFLYKYTI